MSTFSKLRVGKKGTSAGVPTLNLAFSFDPTLASSKVGQSLPKGSVVKSISTNGASTGGTAPTVDIGYDGDPFALADELASDGGLVETLIMGAATTEDLDIVAGVGASAPTGGSVDVIINYYIEDPRNGENN